MFLVATIIIVAISFLLMSLINNLSKIDYLFLKISAYIILCILAFQINKKYNKKFINVVVQIIFIPVTFLSLFTAIAMPIISIQATLGLYLFFSFLIPLILYQVDQVFHILTLNFETWVYIMNTCGVVIAFIFHKQIKFILYKLFPFTSKKSKTLKKYNLEELNNYVISESNIRFVIFSFYFVYLIIINFMSLENNSFYDNPAVDKAILQSFVTFIAFDRVLSTLKQTEFRPSELVDKIWINIKSTFEH